MLKATSEQRAQIDTFFTIIRDHYESIVLLPVIDKKTDIERLAICVVNDTDDGSDIYMMGLWFLRDDPLFDRFERKEEIPTVINKKPHGRIVQCLKKMTRRVYHLFS